MKRELTLEQANRVYDILVTECGASERMREEFVNYHLTKPWYWPTEWRFQGNLGFGGKFWNEHNGWRVSCYQEDETAERRAAMTTADLRLAALRGGSK